MRITNKTGIPEIVRLAAQGLQRDPDPDQWSITELLNPAHQRKLQRDNWEDLEEDVSDKMYALLGTGVHRAIEDGMSVYAKENEDRSQWLVEKHMKSTSLPIHGTMDFYDGETLWDWKTCSSWKVMNKDFKDWERQLNGYMWLMSEDLDLIPRDLKVMTILRDWSKLKAAQDADYPQSQTVIVDIPMWSVLNAGQFFDDRLHAHQDSAPPLCTPEERWAKPTTHAVMKEGRKSAVRVLASADEAEQWVSEKAPKGVISIMERPGSQTRCEHYCSVAHICEYGSKLLPVMEQQARQA